MKKILEILTFEGLPSKGNGYFSEKKENRTEGYPDIFMYFYLVMYVYDSFTIWGVKVM